MQASLPAIRDFLAQRRIAVVGLSHDPKDFSHSVWKELAAHDHDLVGVNAAHAGEELEGRVTLARVQDADPPVDAALVLTSAERSAEAVRDALEAGVRRIWLFRAAGPGAVSDEAIALCKEAGALVIPGECPLMFQEDAAWYHRLHAGFNHLCGCYPADA